MKIAIIIAVVIALGIIASAFLRKAGYRGAIGFKNRHASEIASVRLVGFSDPVDCRSLAQGEHSFNFLGRQDIPTEVQITWRFVGGAADNTVSVSLSGVPGGAADGEFFFVLSPEGHWAVEFAPNLRLDELPRK